MGQEEQVAQALPEMAAPVWRAEQPTSAPSSTPLVVAVVGLDRLPETAAVVRVVVLVLWEQTEGRKAQ